MCVFDISTLCCIQVMEEALENDFIKRMETLCVYDSLLSQLYQSRIWAFLYCALTKTVPCGTHLFPAQVLLLEYIKSCE